MRDLTMADFFVRPSRNIRQENVLGEDQVVTAISLPPASGNAATYVVKHKQSHDWPLAMASVVLDMDGSTVRSARIVMGAVAPIPWRSEAAEGAITGQAVSAASAEQAAAAAVADAEPLDHNGYKVRLAHTAVKRAILEAAGIDWTTG
jgi:xanthine dehydrogenase YagS FAD-binding subunit